MKRIFYIIGIIFIILFIVLFLLFNKNRIYKVESIKIRYAYFTNILTAEGLNDINDKGDYIDILEINLTGDEFDRVSKLLSKERFNKISFINTIIMDKYEVIVNDNIKLSFADGDRVINYAVEKSKNLSTVSYDFINEIANIVEKKAEKNIIKYFSNDIKINDVKSDNYIIVDKSGIDKLNNSFRAVKVNPSTTLLNTLIEKYMINLNNGLNIVVYDNSNVCKVIDNDDIYYVYFISSIDNIVDELWDVYFDKINY